jgi:hypothetical protein
MSQYVLYLTSVCKPAIHLAVVFSFPKRRFTKQNDWRQICYQGQFLTLLLYACFRAEVNFFSNPVLLHEEITETSDNRWIRLMPFIVSMVCIFFKINWYESRPRHKLSLLKFSWSSSEPPGKCQENVRIKLRPLLSNRSNSLFTNHPNFESYRFTWSDNNFRELISVKCYKPYCWILPLSPSKFSPWEAMHQCQRLVHPSKHFWNWFCAMAFRSAVVFFLMSWISSKCLPFNISFIFGNRKKTLGSIFD